MLALLTYYLLTMRESSYFDILTSLADSYCETPLLMDWHENRMQWRTDLIHAITADYYLCSSGISFVFLVIL